MGAHARRRSRLWALAPGVLLAAAVGLPALTTPAARAAAGDLDPTFDDDGIVTTDVSRFFASGRDVAVQRDGRIVVAGTMRTGPEPNEDAAVVARYLPTGALDPSFGGGDGLVTTAFNRRTARANSVALQPDGKIVVAGSAWNESGRNEIAVARFHHDGSPDTAFGGQGHVFTRLAEEATGTAVAVRTDGKLVVGGQLTLPTVRAVVARYHGDGTPDTGFAGTGIVSLAAAQSANGVVESAGRTVFAGTAGGRFAVGGLTEAGALDPTFGTDGLTIVTGSTDSEALAVARQPDGRLVAAGRSGDSQLVARLSADGALDPTFGTGGTVTTTAPAGVLAASDVVVQPDGRIVTTGSTTTDGGSGLPSSAPALAVVAAETDETVTLTRLTPLGALDATFGGDGIVATSVGALEASNGNGAALQADGKIVVTGTSDDLLLVARYVTDLITASVGDTTVVEGDGGTSAATFTVTLSAPAVVPVTVDYTTSDGTAVAPADYLPATGAVTFAPGESTTTLTVSVVGDAEPEPEEAFVLTLTGAVGAGFATATGTARIVDTDAVVPPGASIDDVTILEGDEGTTDAMFTVSLAPPPATAGARVSFSSVADTAGAADMEPVSGTLVFGPAEGSRTITVRVRGDRVDEGTERFTVVLSNPVGTPIADGEGIGKISDDDGLIIDTLAGGPALVERVVVQGPPGGVTLSRLCTDPRQSACIDLTPPAITAGSAPNPRTLGGTRFEVIDGAGLTPATSAVDGDGLVAKPALEIRLFRPVPAVELTLVQGAGSPAVVEAFLTDGTSAGTATRTAAAGVAEALRLPFTPALGVAQQPFALATLGPYVYAADPANHVVRFLDTTTRTSGCPCESVLAGNGAFGATADGADPLQTQLAGPYALAVQRTGSGRVEAYVADTYAHRVLRITPKATGATVTVLAGTGGFGFGGDGGAGPGATLNSPYGIAIDPARDRIYVSDTLNHRVRMINAAGTISTVAGNGSTALSGDGGPALWAGLDHPRALAVDADGTLLIADTGNHTVRRFDPATGIISRVAGTGTAGFSGEGSAATKAQLSSPSGLALDGGDVLVADTGNNRVRRISGETISTVAGRAVAGFDGDGGPATSASLNAPFGVAVAPGGNVLVADTGNNRVRLVSGGTITTLAGNGSASYAGSGVHAPLAQLAGAASVATWRAGSAVAPGVPQRTFVADTFSHTVRVIDQTGAVTTLAGNGLPGRDGDGGPGVAARLDHPVGVAIDRASPPTAVFVADTLNNVVRRIDLASGVITTVAGGGSGGDGPALSAALAFPTGVAVDVAGNLYIAEAYGGRIRKVTPGGVITTVAGTGVLGGAGDGGPGTGARLFLPTSVAADGADPPTLVIADAFNHRVRRLAPDGTISALAGAGGQGGEGDGGPAGAASFNRPFGVGVDAGSGLQVAVADSDGHRSRLVEAGSGTLSRLAAAGAAGFSGDLGPAVDASVSTPRGVGPVLRNKLAMVGDSFGWRVRRIGPPIQRVTPDPVKFRVAGTAVGCTTACAQQVVTVTNAGLATLHLRSAVLGGQHPGDFRLVADRCSGTKLPPGSSCTFRVTFAPTVVCPDTAPCRRAIVTLDGNGADGARQVDIEGAVSRRLVTIAATAKPSGDLNPPGTSAVDAAVVNPPTAGTTPTGQVRFFLCGPGQVTNAGCPAGGSPVGGPIALTTGAATSPTTSSAGVPTTTPGRYCWRVEYLGDGSYLPTTYTNALSTAAAQQPQCFVVRLDPLVRIRSSPADGAPGTSFTDNATVAGPAGRPVPTGTVSFFLCPPGASDPGGGCLTGGVAIGNPVPLAGGTAASPGTASVSYDTSVFGAHCWRARYSGDNLYLPGTGTGFVVFDGGPIFITDCSFVSRQFAVLIASASPGTGAAVRSSSDTVTLTGPPLSPTPTGQVRFFVCRPGTPDVTIGPPLVPPGSTAPPPPPIIVPGRPAEVTDLGCVTGGVEVLPAQTLMDGKAGSSTYTADVDGKHCWRVEYLGSVGYYPTYHTNARLTGSGFDSPACFIGLGPPGPG